MSQENLALAIPTCTIAADDGKTIKNPPTGVIGADKYLKNVTMFAKTIGGKYKKIAIYNAMHETGFNVKAVQKRRASSRSSFWRTTSIATSTATCGRLRRLHKLLI